MYVSMFRISFISSPNEVVVIWQGNEAIQLLFNRTVRRIIPGIPALSSSFCVITRPGAALHSRNRLITPGFWVLSVHRELI